MNPTRAITWLVGVTTNSTILKLQSIYPLQFFRGKIVFKKKKTGEMLIILIIGFELRGLGPLVVYTLLELFIFMTKQKYLRKILERIIIFC